MIKKYNFLIALSDHNAVFFSRKLTKKPRRNLRKSINTEQIFTPNNQERLAAALHNFDWSSILSCDDSDKCCDLLYSSIKQIFSQFKGELFKEASLFLA